MWNAKKKIKGGTLEKKNSVESIRTGVQLLKPERLIMKYWPKPALIDSFLFSIVKYTCCCRIYKKKESIWADVSVLK